MADTRETAAVVALTRRGDRAWHHYAEIIEDAGSALAVLEGRAGETVASAPQLFDPAPRSGGAIDLDGIVDEIESWRAEGMEILTVLDEDYPANLRSIHDRPPLLFVRGRLEDEDEQSIAVVGTRRASAAGLRAARAISNELSRAGYTVVSGLAEGIDAAAHQATLDVGGRTVAVIGTGLRRAYPTSNAALQRRLGEEAAVVSQFWPDAPPTKKTFPMRNVVMSGFALATVVVEASGTSGARMQARFALGHGRPVFLLRELLAHSWARDYAQRPGTFVIESAGEIIERVERLTTFDTLSV